MRFQPLKSLSTSASHSECVKITVELQVGLSVDVSERSKFSSALYPSIADERLGVRYILGLKGQF